MQGEARPEQSPGHVIPPKVKTFIDFESGKSRVEVLQHLDEDSAETQGRLTRDLRTGEYVVLKWLDEQYGPGMVFYPGSGSDRIPKDVFGEDRVVHVSLEEYAKKKS